MTSTSKFGFYVMGEEEQVQEDYSNTGDPSRIGITSYL
jgi:hypothetical protein